MVLVARQDLGGEVRETTVNQIQIRCGTQACEISSVCTDFALISLSPESFTVFTTRPLHICLFSYFVGVHCTECILSDCRVVVRTCDVVVTRFVRGAWWNEVIG